MKSPLQTAIEIVGGQSALARYLTSAIGVNIKQPHVWLWLNKSKKGVPAEYCSHIEKATGGVITREQLRPDVFTSHASTAPDQVNA